MVIKPLTRLQQRAILRDSSNAVIQSGEQMHNKSDDAYEAQRTYRIHRRVDECAGASIDNDSTELYGAYIVESVTLALQNLKERRVPWSPARTKTSTG